jgi:hypothetical protein
VRYPLKSLFNKHKAKQTYRRFKPYAVAGARLGWAVLISTGMYVLDALNNLRIRARMEPFIALAAVATIIYAVFAYNQWQVMHGQLSIMSDQLDQMDIAQRPWLTLSRATPINVSVMDFAVFITLDLRARNIGHSPAEKTFAWGKAYSSLLTTEESDAVIKICKDALGQNLEDLKVMILPDEDIPIQERTFPITVQEIRKNRMDWIDFQYAARMAMLGKEKADEIRDEEMAQPLFSTFRIAGCITYTYRGGNALGQTAFILDVDRPCAESPVGKCLFDVSRPRGYGAKEMMGTEVRRGLFAR